MDAREFIGKMVAVEIDRPLGSKHPTYALVYEINYGFVPDVMAPDGEFLDAYVLGVAEPLSRFEGKCIAVIHRLNDNDDKLVVAPSGMNYTDEQIRKTTAFTEHFFQSVIIRK
jgi:inorganic pyrophosphatase